MLFFTKLDNKYYSFFISLSFFSSCITISLELFLLNIFRLGSDSNFFLFSYSLMTNLYKINYLLISALWTNASHFSVSILLVFLIF
uniref:cytochrome c biogenesis protein transmembrane region n=1 Tax=Phymatolithon calcareum TaxID=1277942 RepID=UPI0023F3EBC9|nr:cytochrome c biogenesis protein transmembrane region [Phymatolithon calcareum]WEA76766.1 cytochrome c biogenesis protein transmembrane region [Phymatolithon calcareum]